MNEFASPSFDRCTLTHLSGNRYRITSRNVAAEDAISSVPSLLNASAVRDASAAVTVSDTYVKKNSTTNYSSRHRNHLEIHITQRTVPCVTVMLDVLVIVIIVFLH